MLSDTSQLVLVCFLSMFLQTHVLSSLELLLLHYLDLFTCNKIEPLNQKINLMIDCIDLSFKHSNIIFDYSFDIGKHNTHYSLSNPIRSWIQSTLHRVGCQRINLDVIAQQII